MHCDIQVFVLQVSLRMLHHNKKNISAEYKMTIFILHNRAYPTDIQKNKVIYCCFEKK